MRTSRIAISRIAACALCASVLALGLALPAAATVTVSGTDNQLALYSALFKPTGQFDEAGLSGFEYLISSRTNEFRAADQYLIEGNVDDDLNTITADIGDVNSLSGQQFSFSIQHNLVGGRNFTFSLTDLSSNATSVLCWGQNCALGSISSALINGIAPISDYNGLQIQVRAQDVVGASAAVKITGLSGVTLAGSPFFDETVTLSSPGSIVPFDAGRRGQWMMADNLDLVQNEWELTGLVTLSRPDAATSDLTKVRLVVDLVRDPSLPFLVPEPSRTFLALCGLALAVAAGRQHARRKPEAPA